MKIITIDSDEKRIEQATAYYMAKGETHFSARELALDQVDWEDYQNEECRWKGPDDSLPLHSY
jgi:hypothetical protein